MRVLTSFLALFLCITAAAAQYLPFPPPPADHLANAARMETGRSVVALNGPWKFYPGDSPIDPVTHAPIWADPKFDDSTWETVDLTPKPGARDPDDHWRGYVPGWTAKGHPGLWGYAWYRIRVEMPPEQTIRDGSLSVWDLNDAYQFYANGELRGGFGKFNRQGKTPFVSWNEPEIFSLPENCTSGPDAGGPVSCVLAFRVWLEQVALATVDDPGGLHIAPVFGESSSVAAYYQMAWIDMIRTDALLPLLAAGLFFPLALATASLALFDRSDRVYLWFAAMFLLAAVSYTNVCVETFTQLVSISQFQNSWALLGPPALGGWAMTWWVWFRLRRPAWVPWAIAALTIMDVIVLSLNMGQGFLAISGPFHEAINTLSVIVRLAFLLLLVLIAARAFRQETREAWIALPAMILVGFTQFAFELFGFHFPMIWLPFGFGIFAGDIADVVSAATMCVLLLRRLSQSIHKQRQRAIDAKQAQEVQRILIPDAIPTVAGFDIQSVYKPAGEVGGDFFQIMLMQNGGALAVIGDVSGKGMPAAMIVSLLVGTIRTLAHYTESPSAILSAMNQRLLARSSGGFTTCLALRADPDGTLTVANAGHLAPYLARKELVLENGLPLGLAAGSAYLESTLHMAPGEQLTLITDGVVEARERTGSLFGFERTAAISNQSAVQIAETAETFGQDDDITVVTLTRNGGNHPL